MTASAATNVDTPEPLAGAEMSEQVSWFLEFAVKPGQSDDVRALIREMSSPRRPNRAR
jgi:hypothetical protein